MHNPEGHLFYPKGLHVPPFFKVAFLGGLFTAFVSMSDNIHKLHSHCM